LRSGSRRGESNDLAALKASAWGHHFGTACHVSSHGLGKWEPGDSVGMGGVEARRGEGEEVGN